MWSRGGKEGVVVFGVSLIVIILSVQILRYNERRQKRLVSEIEEAAISELSNELLRLQKRLKKTDGPKDHNHARRRKKKKKRSKKRKDDKERCSLPVFQESQSDSFSEASKGGLNKSNLAEISEGLAPKNDVAESLQAQAHSSSDEEQQLDEIRETNAEQSTISVAELLFSVFISNCLLV